MLHDYALSRLGNREDAEEAVKRTWARVAEQAHTLEASANGTHAPWLWNIHRNVVEDILRSREHKSKDSPT